MKVTMTFKDTQLLIHACGLYTCYTSNGLLGFSGGCCMNAVGLSDTNLRGRQCFQEQYVTELVLITVPFCLSLL